MWIDYDADGNASATWLTPSGAIYSSGLISGGTPFATAMSGTMLLNSLKVIYGANIRYAPLGGSDPRGRAYQIDAKTDLFGNYDFDYIDPYGVQRNASGTSSPNTLVYAVVCGLSVVSTIKGTTQISTRYC